MVMWTLTDRAKVTCEHGFFPILQRGHYGRLNISFVTHVNTYKGENEWQSAQEQDGQTKNN